MKRIYILQIQRCLENINMLSNILGSYSLETDDWSFRLKDGYISEYQKGNTYCYNYYGISYWTKEDCQKLRSDWAEIYKDNKGVFWRKFL